MRSPSSARPRASSAGPLVGQSLPFMGTFRVGIVAGLMGACIAFVGAIVGVVILSDHHQRARADLRRPSEQRTGDESRGLLYTPAWIAAVLGILPALGALAGIVGGLYALYLLYLALPVLMRTRRQVDRVYGRHRGVRRCARLIVGAVSASSSARHDGAGGLDRRCSAAAHRPA